MRISKEISEDFSSLTVPYHVEHMVIDAIDFGIPQNRRRVFFIGTRLDISVKDMIKAIKQKANQITRTVLQDALAELKPLSAETRINTTTQNSETSGCLIDISYSRNTTSYIQTY